MSLPTPEPGLVICYAYLWHEEFVQGNEEGVKDRPCAIVLACVDEEGEQIVTVVPVTHSPPQNLADAVELPATTKQRLGLDGLPSWVIISEGNSFPWPGPDLRPIKRSTDSEFAYGFLSPSLFNKIQDKFLKRTKAQFSHIVPRSV